MKILILESYLSASHQSWVEGLFAHSTHEISVISLPGRHWKWRMHGAALTMSGKFLHQNHKPELILASDMLDLSSFLALTRKVTSRIPTTIYFHENQLTYPRSERDSDLLQNRDNHYGFINYVSALCADQVIFNSEFHKESFMRGIDELVKRLPDYRDLENLDLIKNKSSVIPVGVNFPQATDRKVQNDVAHILWNHRWEYDKNPEGFIALLRAIRNAGRNFKLIVLGNDPTHATEDFKLFREEFSEEIVMMKYCIDRSEYFSWLLKADILPVCSYHDFFGLSVLEAMACRVYPLLPDRLAYPEHIPRHLRAMHLYDDPEQLLSKIIEIIDQIEKKNFVHPQFDLRDYKWEQVIKKYDIKFEEICQKAAERL